MPARKRPKRLPPIAPQPPDADQEPTQHSFWLRKGDQEFLGLVVAASIVGLLFFWVRLGGIAGRTVNFDDTPPRELAVELDVNQADWQELSDLPAIGPELAKEIVRYRERHGPFRSLDDLDRVKGVGPKTLARIRQYLAPISGETTTTDR